MTNWYYATANGQQHGPLPAEQLRALVAAGTISPQTLVWREGQQQWQPLHQVQAELGLHDLPPPLPSATYVPPRTGMSGCMIAVLLGVGVMVVIAVLGILAAIALPAYQDYTVRSHVSLALVQVQAQRLAVSEFVAEHGRCPENGDPGFDQADDYAAGELASLVFGRFQESGYCGLEATIAAPGKPSVDGKVIWLEMDPETGTWTCSSNAADKHLPASCRG